MTLTPARRALLQPSEEAFLSDLIGEVTGWRLSGFKTAADALWHVGELCRLRRTVLAQGTPAMTARPIRWEMVSTPFFRTQSEVLERLLAEGFEPFAVTGSTVLLKRPVYVPPDGRPMPDRDRDDAGRAG